MARQPWTPDALDPSHWYAADYLPTVERDGGLEALANLGRWGCYPLEANLAAWETIRGHGNAIRLTGAGELIAGAPPFLGPDKSAFLVLATSGRAGPNPAIQLGERYPRLELESDGLRPWWRTGPRSYRIFRNTEAQRDGLPHVWILTADGGRAGAARLYVDGAEVRSVGSGGGEPRETAPDFRVARFRGRIFELGMVPRVITERERRALGAYLYQRWCMP